MLLNGAYPIFYILMARNCHGNASILGLLGGRFMNSIRLWPCSENILSNPNPYNVHWSLMLIKFCLIWIIFITSNWKYTWDNKISPKKNNQQVKILKYCDKLGGCNPEDGEQQGWDLLESIAVSGTSSIYELPTFLRLCVEEVFWKITLARSWYSGQLTNSTSTLHQGKDCCHSDKCYEYTHFWKFHVCQSLSQTCK